MKIEIQQKQKIKRFLAKIFPYCNKRRNSARFTILTYHSVDPFHKLATSPKDFEEQIKFLSLNYNIQPLGNIFNFKTDSFAITFDDGYEDNFNYALPILKKYNCPATFFICTGFIDGKIDITRGGSYQDLKPLSGEQIKIMRDAGMNFGCHTHSHPSLDKISLADAENEINKSKIMLEGLLQEKADLFAYPFGQLNSFNKHIIEILKKGKFVLACSTLWGSNDDNFDHFNVRRIRIDSQDTFADFQAKLRGDWDFISWFNQIKII